MSSLFSLLHAHDPEEPAVPGWSRVLAGVLGSGLSGMLVAALLLPPVAVAAAAVSDRAESLLALPAELTAPVVAQRTTLLAADGSFLARLYAQNRVPVSLDAVPLHVRQALIAVEDARFYEHSGVDVLGVVRAALENVTAGEVTQGGSTITQQYVKMALVAAADTEAEQRAATEESYDRKLREARLALALERQLGKDEILRRYLNLAYFGNGAYGIAAAAQYYFAKPVRELTVAEGALLVGLAQGPSRLDPLTALPAALDRRNTVLRRMYDVGYLTRPQLDAALAERPALQPTPVTRGCVTAAHNAAFFCDYVRAELETGPLGAALGATRELRQQRLLTGGLTIRTTLQPRLQAAAQRQLDAAVPRADPSGVAATFTAVEPGTGQVRALAVNRTYAETGPGSTKVNLPLGGSSGMQAGSTFKPFVLAAALEQGIGVHETMYAPDTYTSRVFADCAAGTCEPYTVGNAGDSAAGWHDLISATHESVNTFYVQLLERTGVERPAQIAEAMGLKQFTGGRPSAPLHRGGSFVLGVNEVSPLALTAAYAAFAAFGTYCPPRPVLSITGPDGTPVPLPEPRCTQAVAPEVADTVTSVLRGNVDGPWAKTGGRASIGRPAAGKTGSTNGSTAAWFAGYTPQLAAAVWVGKPVPSELRRIRIGGQYYRQVYGGNLPASIWSGVMSEALTGVPVAAMPPAARPDPRVPKR